MLSSTNIFLTQRYSRINLIRGRYRVVGTATRYGLDDLGFEPLKEQGIFFFLHTRPDRPWGLANPLFNAYRGSLPVVNRPWGAVGRPSPSCVHGMLPRDLYLFH